MILFRYHINVSMHGFHNELELKEGNETWKGDIIYVKHDFKSCTMWGEMIKTYHLSKLLKLNIIQHIQCLLPLLYLLPPTSNLSWTPSIKVLAQYWNRIFSIKNRNYGTNRDFEPWCQVVSSFGDLLEQYVLTILPSIVWDFKSCSK